MNCATKCQILRLKCTKIDFRWGSAPDPARPGSLQRSPRALSWILGAILLRKGDIGRKGNGEREGKAGGAEEREGRVRE